MIVSFKIITNAATSKMTITTRSLLATDWLGRTVSGAVVTGDPSMLQDWRG
jgi:hypothetical protein